MTTKNNAPAFDVEAAIAFYGIPESVTYQPDVRGKGKPRPPIPMSPAAIVRRHPAMLRYGFIGGLFGALGNVSYSQLSAKLGRDATESDMERECLAIVANWTDNGTWTRSGGGERDSIVRYKWDVYFAEKGDATETARATRRKNVAAAVEKTLGKGESATFDNLCRTLARIESKRDGTDVGEVLARIESHYATEAGKLRDAERAAKADVETTDDDFDI
jgi:hypothetical protein